jgi:hypothetical protein
LKCRALKPQMITATQRGLRNREGGVLGEEVITPSPPASDETISGISYPSDLTVLNSIIKKNFVQFLFHAGRSPQRPQWCSGGGMRGMASSQIIWKGDGIPPNNQVSRGDAIAVASPQIQLVATKFTTTRQFTTTRPPGLDSV